MSITPASQKGLYSESQLSGTLEESGFLRPLDAVSGIEHIGWFNTVEPVFRLVDGASVNVVGKDIQSRVRNGEFDSAGLRGFVVPEGMEAGEVRDIFSDAVLMVKVENWWRSCVPNRLQEEAEIQEYIAEREEKMRGKLSGRFSGGAILDRHANISVAGGSLDGSYGQYQYVAWK